MFNSTLIYFGCHNFEVKIVKNLTATVSTLVPFIIFAIMAVFGIIAVYFSPKILNIPFLNFFSNPKYQPFWTIFIAVSTIFVVWRLLNKR
jgi:hypothetical protein